MQQPSLGTGQKRHQVRDILRLAHPGDSLVPDELLGSFLYADPRAGGFSRDPARKPIRADRPRIHCVHLNSVPNTEIGQRLGERKQGRIH